MAKKKFIVSRETETGWVGFRESTKTLFFECGCGTTINIGPELLKRILPKIQKHLNRV